MVEANCFLYSVPRNNFYETVNSVVGLVSHNGMYTAWIPYRIIGVVSLCCIIYLVVMSQSRTRPVVIIEHPLNQVKVIRFVVWQLWLFKHQLNTTGRKFFEQYVGGTRLSVTPVSAFRMLAMLVCSIYYHYLCQFDSTMWVLCQPDSYISYLCQSWVLESTEA